jgi:hypothetical protein
MIKDVILAVVVAISAFGTFKYIQVLRVELFCGSSSLQRLYTEISFSCKPTSSTAQAITSCESKSRII